MARLRAIREQTRAEMAQVLEGSNVEAARAAVLSLTGEIPVFEEAGKVYGRLSVDAVPLFGRCNLELVEQVGSGGPIWHLFSASQGENQTHLGPTTL